jgi:hypothetical protein
MLVKQHKKDRVQANADGMSAIQAVVEQVQRNMLAKLQPIFQLFAVSSISKTIPGDKYLVELKFLKTKLTTVRAAQGAAPLASITPAKEVTWGIGSMNLTLPVPLSTCSGPKWYDNAGGEPFHGGKN